MTVSLLSIGLISILGQVILLRELNVAFYGVELVYLLALGIWLFWTAAGAVAGGLVRSPSVRGIAALFILFGLLLPPDVVFLRGSRLLFGGMPGAYLSFAQQLAVAALALLPAGFLSGVLFQWAARVYVATGRTLATAYAVESAGGLVGGLAATLLLLAGLSNFAGACLCGLAAVITPLAVLRKHDKAPSLRWTAAAFVFVMVALLWQSPVLDRRTTIWNHPNLLESADSPYGRITVTRLHGQFSVFENDALAFETEGTEAEAFCHPAALQHPKLQTVLILGGGGEGLVREAAKYRPQRIDYVELNPVLLELSMQHLPGDIVRSLREPNVRIIVADPRRFLLDSTAYDLILVGMPEPSSGQANRFYTRDFFALCAAKLKPGGILALRLRTAENLWPPPLARRNASIYRALKAVFPEVLFLPGTTNVVTASRTPLPRSAEALSRRLQSAGISARLVSPNYLRYLFTNDRFREIHEILERETAMPNTDTRPVCYQYAFVVWLAKFFPRLAVFDPSAVWNRGLLRSPFLWAIFIALPVLFLIGRIRPDSSRFLLVAVAGFLGMVAETVLILHYQVKFGVLYRDIGLLLMSFMAGLAVGALAVKRLLTRPFPLRKHPRRYGFGLLAGFGLLCAYLAWTTATRAAGLAETATLLFAAGFLVAGIFAYAGLHDVADQQKVIAPLYTADLIGGCAGSLLASLVLIPLAGMDVTSIGLLLLAAFSLILI